MPTVAIVFQFPKATSLLAKWKLWVKSCDTFQLKVKASGSAGLIGRGQPGSRMVVQKTVGTKGRRTNNPAGIQYRCGCLFWQP
jgi:hypothetical protein